MTEYIDKIIYINLEHRTDRREQIEGELDKFNLSYERFNAIKTKKFTLFFFSNKKISFCNSNTTPTKFQFKKFS